MSYFLSVPQFSSAFTEDWSAFCLDICKQTLPGKILLNSLVSEYIGDFTGLVQWNLKWNIKTLTSCMYFFHNIIQLQKYFMYSFKQYLLEPNIISNLLKVQNNRTFTVCYCITALETRTFPYHLSLLGNNIFKWSSKDEIQKAILFCLWEAESNQTFDKPSAATQFETMRSVGSFFCRNNLSNMYFSIILTEMCF